MASKIYTKTGDGGFTSLLGGTKISKSHLRIETYGTVDELNSHTGLWRDQLSEEQSISTLKKVQDRLFTIGSSLACDPEKEPLMKIPDLRQEDISLLEEEIDRMEEILPPMKNFILPGGHVAVSQGHICRCVCRRVERLCVHLQQESFVEPLIIKYLNRLSDYFFVLSRFTGHLLGVAELKWQPRV